MITVVMTTYVPEGGEARILYAHQALEGLLNNLGCSQHKLRLHVADDGSRDQEFILDLMERAANEWGTESSSSTVHRKGIGGSLNAALAPLAERDLWLYTTDDWVLEQPLNLDKAVALIEEREYKCVRLCPVHPNLLCITRFEQSIGWWLECFPAHGGYVFGTRPFLASMEMVKQYGPFPEQLDAYETERIFAERVAAVGSMHEFAIDVQYGLEGPWKHIGEYEVGRIQP